MGAAGVQAGAGADELHRGYAGHGGNAQPSRRNRSDRRPAAGEGRRRDRAAAQGVGCFHRRSESNDEGGQAGSDGARPGRQDDGGVDGEGLRETLLRADRRFGTQLHRPSLRGERAHPGRRRSLVGGCGLRVLDVRLGHHPDRAGERSCWERSKRISTPS
jgi:hypothetical protein